MRPLFAALFVSLVCSHAVFGQARILIEKIEVQHPAGIPDRILLSEMRLAGPGDYTEDEIRQAVYRIRRLPFVLRADYRLEQGSSFEARRLVIVVEPVKRFNMMLDLGYQRREDFDIIIFSPSASYRTFVGTSALEAGVGATSFSDGGGDFRNFNLQYSGYDLFGTGTVVQLGLGLSVSSGDTRRDPSPTARIVVPLTQLQSIVATYASFGEERDFDLGITGIPVTTSFDQRTAELSWVRDTTDDPLFTLRGTTIAAGLQVFDFETRSPRLVGNPPAAVYVGRTESQTGLHATANHFFPLGERSTIHLSFDGLLARLSVNSDVVNRTSDIGDVQALATIAHNIGSVNRHRFEAGLAYRVRTQSSVGEDSSLTESGFTAAYIYRHRRFFFRLSAIYY